MYCSLFDLCYTFAWACDWEISCNMGTGFWVALQCNIIFENKKFYDQHFIFMYLCVLNVFSLLRFSNLVDKNINSSTWEACETIVSSCWKKFSPLCSKNYVVMLLIPCTAHLMLRRQIPTFLFHNYLAVLQYLNCHYDKAQEKLITSGLMGKNCAGRMAMIEFSEV